MMRFRMEWWQWLTLAGLTLALAGAVVAWRGLHVGPAPAGELKTVTEIRDDTPLPGFHLAGPHGAFTNASLQGKWSFVFFGYTQCPDVCPTALSLMKEVKARLAAVSPPSTFQVVFVSVDPVRDTHPLLNSYMAAFDREFIGVTGDDAALASLTKALGVFFQRNDVTDKQHYTVDHSTTIYLIDPQGRLAAVFSPPQIAENMAADFRRISTR